MHLYNLPSHFTKQVLRSLSRNSRKKLYLTKTMAQGIGISGELVVVGICGRRLKKKTSRSTQTKLDKDMINAGMNRKIPGAFITFTKL